MRAANRVGIAKVILRDVQHLAALEVIGNALVLTLLRFADELVDTSEWTLPADKAVSKAELDMAKSLVESLATEWKPDKYTDEYRDNLMRVIRAKAKGKKITLESTTEPRQAKVIDLMERLRQSLAQSAPARKATRAGGKRKRRSAA